MTLRILAKAFAHLRACFSKPTRRDTIELQQRHAALESLEPRMVLTTLTYTVDNPAAYLAANPGGLQDGKIDLAVKVTSVAGSPVLQLVDVDKAAGGQVVGTAPFIAGDPIIVNITGWSTDVDGHTEEFPEQLTIDLANNTGLTIPSVPVTITLDGIKGTAVPLLQDDLIVINPSNVNTYSPSILNVTLKDGEKIVLSGPVTATGDVTLKGTESDIEVTANGSINTSGDISLSTTAVLTTNGDADSLDALAMLGSTITVNGGSLIGQDISLSTSISANVTISSTTLRNGQFNVGGVVAISNSTIVVDGNAQLQAAGNLALAAVSTITTSVIRGAQDDGDSSDDDRQEDAAIAASAVTAAVGVRLSDNANLTAGGSANITSANTVNVTTTADGSLKNGNSDSTQAGGTLATATVVGDTEVLIEDAVTIATVGTLTINSTSNRTVITSSKSTPKGAADDGNPGTKTSGQTALSDNNASTSDGAMTLAAAISVNTVMGETRALVTGGNLSSSQGSILIGTTANHNIQTLADGTVSTGDNGTGVGVAAAIGLAGPTDPNGATGLRSTARVAGSVTLNAASVSIQSTAPQNNFKTQAISGPSGPSQDENGNSTGSDIGIAGALAIGVTIVNSTAQIAPGSNVTTNGNVNINATSNTLADVQALPKEHPVSGKSLGLGAGVGINITDIKTLAQLGNGATLSGANDLNISANSNNSMSTIGKAGAAGGTALAAAVAFELGHNDTQAVLDTGSDLNVTGQTTLATSHTGNSAAKAEGDAEGGSDAAIGAAVSISLLEDKTESLVNRNLISGKAVSITSSNNSSSSANAKASAQGESDSGANDDANSQAAAQRGAADSQASSRGARSSSDAATNPDASTSEGGVTVAAAIAFNLARSTTRSNIASNMNVSAGGPLTVKSLDQTVASAVADGSATDSETGVGAAVAINAATAKNYATIGTNAVVTADGITVEANKPGAGNSQFSASSISGVGASDVGIAGSLSINMARVDTRASLESGSVTNLVDGPDQGTGVGELKILANSSTNNTTSATATANANGDAGVGASVAFNLTDHDTLALIDNGAVVTGANNVSVTANSQHPVTTTATGGAAGGTAITPVATATLAFPTTEARIGTSLGNTLTSGSVTISADHSGDITSKAIGKTNGTDAAIGASLSFTYAKEDVTATLQRNLTTGGDLSITSRIDAAHPTQASASASGAKGEDTNQGGTVQNKNDQLRSSSNSKSKSFSGTDSGEEKKATATTNDKDGNSSDVSVAAAIAVNIIEASSRASIDKGLTIQTDGAVKVSSTQDVDATATADGSASKGDIGIGAAVSINVVDVDNEAKIGLSDITADGLTVEALMTKPAPGQSETSTFTAIAKSGAGGKDVGVAGSLAINHIEARTTAKIEEEASIHLADGGDLLSTIGPVSIKAQAITDNKAEALPDVIGGGASGDVGVGASVALNILYLDTLAEADNGAALQGDASSITINAQGDHQTTTTAVNGAAAGDVGIGGSVAVVISKSHTTSRLGVGAGLTTSSGDIAVTAKHNNVLTTQVDSAAQGGDAAIAASVGVVLVEDTVDASLERNVQAGQNVSVISDTDTQSTLNVKASAGGGDKDESNPDETADDQANQQANQANTTGGGQNTLPKTEDSSNSANSKSDDESGGSSGSDVGIAASVAINALSIKNSARILNGADATALNGDVTVSAKNHIAATSEADSTSVDLSGDVSVGAAVSLNWVSLTNQATVDSGSVLSGNDVTIEAVVTDIQTNDYMATAFAAAGNTGDVSVAGVVAINVVDADTTAKIADGTTINATGDVHVTAEHTMRAQAGAVAAAVSGEVGIAAAVAINILGLNEAGESGGSKTLASIGEPDTASTGAMVHADGEVNVSSNYSLGMFPTLNLSTTMNDPNGLNMQDINEEVLSMAVSGGGSTGKLGAAGSASINLLESTTHANIDRAAHVESGELFVTADDNTAVNSLAGALGVSTSGAGVGLGLDLNIIHKDTQAEIGRQAVVTATQAAHIHATSTETLTGLAATVGIGNNAGVGGSAVVQVVETTTTAGIEDADTAANGAALTAKGVDIDATGNLKTRLISGALGVGGNAGVGATNATLVHHDTVQAKAGNYAHLTSTADAKVNASSTEEILTIAAAAGAASSAGVAGAAVVTDLSETTIASVGHGAVVNVSNGLPLSYPNLLVTAKDTTDIVSIGGSLAAGGSAGVGVGVDVANFNKLTSANVGSGVTANIEGNLVITGDSSEDVTSIAAGLSASGNASVSLDASVHVANITTRAYIGALPTETSLGAGDVHAEGSIMVAADDRNELDKVVGVLAASGGAAVAGGAAVSTITKTTEAFIGQGAKVTADGQHNAINARTGKYVYEYVNDTQGATGVESNSAATRNQGVHNLALAGEVHTPKLGDVDMNQDGNNNDVKNGSLTGQRTLSLETQPGFRGIAIVATNRDDIENYSLSAALSSSAAVGIAAGVNVLNLKTRAYTGQGSNLNDSLQNASGQQSVLIAANSDLGHVGFAGSVAGGSGAGIGPAADITILNGETSAILGASVVNDTLISAPASAKAKKHVEVEAQATEDLLLVGVGVGGGTVGIGAGVDVLSFNNHTHAMIGTGSSVQAGGNVAVLANDDSNIVVVSGGGGGGIVGAGAGVGVMSVAKDTLALIDMNATVDAQGNADEQTGIMSGDLDSTHSELETINAHGVVVQATTKEEIAHVAVALAGGYVGVSGAVAVTMINSDTKAEIANGAQINQAAGNPGADQSVYVNAGNVVNGLSFAGSAGAGLVGAAGAVGYGTVKNDTTAHIGSDAHVKAKNDVEVNAVGLKNIDDYTISGAGGGVGIAAAVSIWSIGSPLRQTYSDEHGQDNDPASNNKNKSAHSDAAGQSETTRNYLSSQMQTFQGNGKAKSNSTRVSSISGGAGQSLFNSAPSSTSISDSLTGSDTGQGTVATIGEFAEIHADGDINVNALERVDVDITAGGVGVGLGGVGASVSVLSTATHAIASANGILDAGGDVGVTANLNLDVQPDAIAGGAGLIGLGAAVVDIQDKSVVQAAVGSVTAADTVKVNATSDRFIELETDQFNAGAVAAGASFTTLSVQGAVGASVNGGAQIGQQAGKTVGSLDVNSTSTLNAHNSTTAIAAGGVAVSANLASANMAPVISTGVGANATVKVSGAANVQAVANHSATTEVLSLTGGVVSVGTSISKAEMAGNVHTNIANGAGIEAGSINIAARLNHDGVNPTGQSATAHAQAPSAVPGLAAGTGTDAKAQANTSVVVSTGNDSQLKSTSGNVNVTAAGSHVANADGLAVSLGLANAVGVTIVEATSNGETRVNAEGGIDSAAALNVKAIASNQAIAPGEAASASVVGAGTGVISTAAASPKVEARVSTDDFVKSAGTFKLHSQANNTATSTGSGGAFAAAIGIGMVSTSATTNGQSNTLLGGDINADTLDMKSSAVNTPKADGKSAAGGLGGSGASVTATVDSQPSLLSKITGKVRVNSTAEIIALSTNTPTADAFTVALAAGAAVGGGIASVTSKPTVHSTIEGGSISAPTLNITADDTSTVTSDAGALAGGLGGTNGASMATNIVAADIEAGIVHGLHKANTVNIAALEHGTHSASADGKTGGGFTKSGGAATTDVANKVRARVSNDVMINLDQPGTGDIVIQADDHTTVNNVVDQTAVGGGTEGAAASYVSVKNKVDSHIDGLAIVKTTDNVKVLAHEDVTVNNTAVGIAAGLAGLSGNVAVNALASEVNAFIANQADVSANRSVLVSADMVDTVNSSSKGIAAGAFGQGGTTMINTFDNVARARVDANSKVKALGTGVALSVPTWDKEGVQTNVPLNGLGVIAHTQEKSIDPDGNGALPASQVQAFNASGGLSGHAAINAINVVNDRAEAFIARSEVNSASNIGNDVLVHAATDTPMRIHADGVAGGIDSSGGVSTRTTITNTTRAFISDFDETQDLGQTPSVVYGKDVEVSAMSHETITLDSKGITGGGFSLAGSTSNAEIASTTAAFTRDSQVISGGELSILAGDSSSIEGETRTAVFAGIAGGTAIEFNTIKNSVKAQVIGGDLFAYGALDVHATSTEMIDANSYAVGGGFAALAGTVALNVIETTTEANVVKGDAEAKINQVDPGIPNQVFQQSVHILANDDASILNKQGTDVGGLLGAGASVEFGSIRNRTVATVGPESKIYAVGDIDIKADSSRQLDSDLNAVAGGILGLSGAVSFLTLGTPTTDDVNKIMEEFLKNDGNGGESLESQTNGPSKTEDVSSSIQDEPGAPGTLIAASAAAKVDQLDDATVQGSISSSQTERMTGALVIDAPSAATKSYIKSEGNLTIDAHNDYNIQQDVGSLSGGLVAFGASFGITKVHQETRAELGKHNALYAAGDITINSNDINTATPIDMTVKGGVGGAIGATINLAELTVDSKSEAAIDNNAFIELADKVLVTSNLTAIVDIDGRGFSGNGVASAGVVEAKTTLTTKANSSVNDGAKIGTVRSVGALRVGSSSTVNVTNEAKVGAAAVAGGISSGESNTLIKPTVAAHIGDADVAVLRNTLVDTHGTFLESNKVSTLAAGALGDGSGISIVEIDGSIHSQIDDNATIETGNLSVTADQMNTTTTEGMTIGGGIVGGQASKATNTISLDTLATVGKATITADDYVKVIANSTTTATATSQKEELTGIGEGSSQTNVTIQGDVQATMTGTHVQAGQAIHLLTDSKAIGSADSLATAFGLFNGNAAGASVNIDVDTLSEASADANLTATDEIRIEALSQSTADTKARGSTASLLSAAGWAVSDSTVNSSTHALADGTLTSQIGYIRVQATDQDSHANAESVAAGVGLVDAISKTTSNAVIAPSESDTQAQVRARLAGNVHAASDIAVRAQSDGANTSANTKGISISGAFSSAETWSKSTLSPTLRSSIGNNSSVTSEAGDVKVEAHNQSKLNTAHTDAIAGSLAVSLTEATATAKSNGETAAVVGQAHINALKGTVLVQADTARDTFAQSNGISASGLLGIGNVKADAISGAPGIETNSSVNSGATITAANLTMTATEDAYGLAYVVGTGGGFISDQGAMASASVQPTANVLFDTTATATLSHDAFLRSRTSVEGDAEAEGNSFGAVKVARSDAKVTLTPTANSTLGKDSHIHADHNIDVSAQITPTGQTVFASNFNDKTPVQRGTTSVVAHDGFSQSRAIGGSADGDGALFYGEQGSSAIIEANPSALVTIATPSANQPATLDAGNDLTLSTSSRSNVDTQITNKSIAFLGVGNGHSLAGSEIAGHSQIAVQPGVKLSAGHDMNIDAAARHVASADALSQAYGVISLADANSYAEVNYTTESRIGAGAELNAGNALQVTTTTNSMGDADATADGAGLGAVTHSNTDGGDSNSDNDVSIGGAKRGVRIGHFDGDTRTEVESGAKISAKEVRLQAHIDRSHGSSTTSSDSGGAEADAYTMARIELSDDARVNLRSGAEVTGTDLVVLESAIQNMNMDFSVHAKAAGIVVAAVAYAINDSDQDIAVLAEDNATIITHDLQVKSLATSVDYPKYDLSKPNLMGDFGLSRTISFDADAMLTSGPAVLRIGPDGLPIQQQNVTYKTQGDTLVVDDITNANPGKVLFHTDQIVSPADEKAAPVGRVYSDSMYQALAAGQPIEHGIGPQLTFKETMDEVVIENQSPKSLQIGNISVVNKSIEPNVAIETESLELQLFNPPSVVESFGFDVKHVFGPTNVSIVDSVNSLGTITLGGLIDNPIGHTEITNAGGSIATTAAARIRTSDLDMQATGMIGSAGNPLPVDLVESAGKPVDLDVHTPSDVHLNIRGLVRDAAASQFDFSGGTIEGDNLNITLSESLLQATLDPSIHYLVKVTETFTGPPSTEVENRFRDDLSSLTVLDLGIFGIQDQAIPAAMQFQLLKATGNINVVAAAGKPIDLSATTDIVGLGKLLVTNNGDIHLTESVGDMRVAAITSLVGNVFLATTAGSIIDVDNDAAADVSGHNLTFNVLVGGIGTQVNPLDIDSSLGQVGAGQNGIVHAQSIGGLYLVETAGIFNAGLIKSPGAVALKTINGAIVDALNENLINISGQTISLVALGISTSTIGEVGDRLEVCTSSPMTNQAGGSIYLFNVCGLLKINFINSGGSVNLAAAGNIELEAGGSIEAADGIELSADLDLILPATSQLLAGQFVTLKAGQALTEGNVGALVRSEGTINVPQLDIYGGPAHDTFLMKHQSPQAGRGVVNLFAGAGNDTLDIADLTDEVFAYGELGDDIFLVNDLAGRHLFGDRGQDTMQLKSAAVTLDLTRLGRDVLSGLETLDVDGSGRNSISLDRLAVMSLSDETDTLIVKRNRDDQVDIGPGWTFVGNEIIDRQLFKVYTNDGATIKVQSITALVMGRSVFYNRSFFDGNSTEPGAGDDAAIATDKAPLINGTATLANITNYSRGINGIMIDVFNLPEDVHLTAEDFRFRMGNTDTPGTWAVAPNPSSITIRREAGVAGAHRITLIWPDNVIQRTWLQVSILANTNTTLESDDVFYFGNAIGDVGDSATNTIVNATDIAAIVSNQNSFLNPARITSPYDLNHDRLINATDVAIAVSNQTNFLNALRLIRISSTTGGRFVGGKSASAPLLISSSASGLQPSSGERRTDERMPLTSDVARLNQQIASSIEKYRSQVDNIFGDSHDDWSAGEEQTIKSVSLVPRLRLGTR